MRIWAIYIALIMLSIGDVAAQRLWLMEGDTTLVQAQALIDFSAFGGWESNALENEMLDKLLFGGHIERDLIDRQGNRINDFLRAGGRYDASLRFWLFRDSLLRPTNWAWQAQIQSKAQLGMAAPADLYNLVFKGNSPDFLGRNARMDELWVDYMAYQKFGLGLVHKPTLSGFVISAVNGQEFDRLYLLQGGVFTSASGDSLAFGAMGDRFRSDPNTNGLGVGNGFGLAFDGVFNLPLKENKGFVSIGATDMGFVLWNDASQHTKIDTVWSFTGVDIAEFITDGDNALPQIDDSLLTTTSSGRMNRWLPGFVYTRLMHTISDRDFFDITMAFRPINAFLPMFSAGYHYRLPNHRALVGASAIYGGFGGVRFGISAEKWFGNQWFAALAADDIHGLVSRRGRGMAASVRLTYLLKRNETTLTSAQER